MNVTLLFSIEAYGRVADAFIRGLERRLAEGRSSTCTRWRASSSRGSTRRSTSASSRPAGPSCAEPRRSPMHAPPTGVSRRCSRVNVSRSFAAQALRCSGRSGRRPGSRTRTTRRPCTSIGLVGPDTVNTMPMPTLLAVAERGEIAGPTADQDPAAQLDGARRCRHRSRRRDRQGARRRHRGFPASDGEAARRGGRPPRGSRHPPAAGDQRDASRRARAGHRGAGPEGRGRGRCATRRRRDVSLWGEKGTPEIADRLGWLTISDPMLEHAAELRESPTTAGARDSPMRCCSEWAVRASARR